LRPAVEPAGQVHVDDVEPAGSEAQVEGGGVDDDLVPFAHLPQQPLVGPGGPALTADLDDQRRHGDDDAPPQVEAPAHARSRIPSQTSSILSRSRAATCSLVVWTASGPLARRTL